MLISFLGDSITQGVGASESSKSYVELVGTMLKEQVNNCGISGTRIARRKEAYIVHSFDLDFNLRATVLDKKSDLVVVFGGTNDYGHGDADMGDYNGKEVYTFYGAMRTLVEKLIGDFGREKVKFILPCHRFDEDGTRANKYGYTLKEFVEAERKILDEYKIDYLDLFDGWVKSPKTDAPSEYFTDGVHPNDKGHYEIAKKVCEFIRKNS